AQNGVPGQDRATRMRCSVVFGQVERYRIRGVPRGSDHPNLRAGYGDDFVIYEDVSLPAPLFIDRANRGTKALVKGIYGSGVVKMVVCHQNQLDASVADDFCHGIGMLG